MPTPRFSAPELLSPAGSWDCLRAAVANGANAVYFGLPRLNARIRADNFSEAELPAVMDWLHDRGVRGFLTLNTLVFTSELPLVHEFLKAAAVANVDAVIVQDLGVARIIRDRFPTLELHASTQMTLTSPEGLALARGLGVHRAVLGRELSLREIEKVIGADILPVEVFVHGALCVAYSGQCLTSEALGQRSANRGECAQACRMPYELIVDGETQDLGDQRYLLSPQDLAGVSVIPELVRMGVASCKIEGRLKTPEYVAAVTRVYRKAIDEAVENASASPTTPEDHYALEMTFSRGLYTGWFHGVHHQELVHAKFGKKRGIHLGCVTNAGADWIELDQPAAALPGEGIVIANPADTERELGGNVTRIEGRKLFLHRGRRNFGRAAIGAEVYKTSDPKLEKELRRSFAADPPRTRIGIRVTVRGRAGEALEIEAESETGGSTLASSSMPLLAAESQPLTLKRMQAQLGRLGNTDYQLTEVVWEIEGDVMLPVSELNRLRRALIERLSQSMPATVEVARSGVAPESWNDWLAGFRGPDPCSNSKALHLICRTEAQVDAALANETLLDSVILDFEDIRRFEAAVHSFRERRQTSLPIYLATPRIQKAGETGMFRLIERAGADGVLVRNLGGLFWFRDKGLPMAADFSLNAANPIGVQTLLELGARRITLSFDLVVEEVEALMATARGAPIEIVVHQHMPMFHMEHCVFAAFLSEGRDFRDCGRPCERHQVEVRDRVGMAHPLAADVGCRNTVFNAVPQTAALYLSRLDQAGIREFRLDLLRESAEEAGHLIRLYSDWIRGVTPVESTWERLKARSQFGVTRGTLEERSLAGVSA